MFPMETARREVFGCPPRTPKLADEVLPVISRDAVSNRGKMIDKLLTSVSLCINRFAVHHQEGMGQELPCPIIFDKL